MNNPLFPIKYSTNRLGMIILPLISLGFFIIFLGGASYGYAQLSITSSGLNTQVSVQVNLPSGTVQHNITGGTRPGGGANLFHSFGEFGVSTDNIANFLNDTGLQTTNILSRVTGGTPSNILGTVKTEGFGNANLFLMNPAGIVFGPNASLNVSGDIHFTTADYLKLSDGVEFKTLPGAQDMLLSVSPVEAFGFLGSIHGPISVDGSTLSVANGKTISFVGGDVSIDSSISVPGGKIGLASVGSSGEVLINSYVSSPNVNGESFTTMGGIVLSAGATLDVSGNATSGDAAGTVIIRGGQLTMNNATISADTGDSDGTFLGVDIQLTGDLTITDTQGRSAITSRTIGSGNAGKVQISAKNLNVTSSSLEKNPFAMIDTHTSGNGTGGDVDLTVSDTILALGERAGSLFLIDTGAINDNGGHGGDVAIEAAQFLLTDADINTGDFIGQIIGGPTGSGGDLAIAVDTFQLTSSTLATDGFWEGKAGDINITARDIHFKDFSSLNFNEFGGGGEIHITANSLLLDASDINGGTVDGRGIGVPWDGVILTVDRIELRDGSTIRAQTDGDGAAGNIRITAIDQIIISDDPSAIGTKTRPSGLFAISNGNADLGLGDQGAAGAIFIETGKLTMSGGARIDSTTGSSGRGGDVTLNATNGVIISGARPVFPNEETFSVLGSRRPSGIFSRTVGREPASCTGQCGDAGNISITAGFLNVGDGAAINSGTTSNGEGGMITVSAVDNISIAGMLDDGAPGGVFSRTTGTDQDSGEGGTIALTAGNSFFLRDGATVSTSSSGLANAGNIHLTAVETILLDSSTVATEASQGSGGNIELTAQDLILLNDTTISSSVQGNADTAGGNISLDPEFIILQNSQILAKAVEGQGGNISLVATNAVLADPFSVLDASSALGVSGSVDIQAPIQNLSGTLAPLPEDTIPVTSLYGARCATGQGGHFSTFVNSKAESLSPKPGRFLASPLLIPLAQTVAATPSSTPQQSPVILTASIAPLLLGKTGEPTTACP